MEGCVFSGKIHYSFALIIWLLLVLIPDNPPPLKLIPFLIGSVFPDADHRKAPMGRILPLWLFFKHRGFTHTIWGLIFFGSILSLFTSMYWTISFSLGFLLHLMMDSSTPMGVNWLGKKKKPYRMQR
jgi:membrane-bound metal-dependent hydrolase YbcI (DUF457 family)